MAGEVTLLEASESLRERTFSQTQDLFRLLFDDDDGKRVAWDFTDITPTKVPCSHTFDLVYGRTIDVPFCRLSSKHKKTVEQEVDKMLKAEISEHAVSPWGFGVVVDTKKDGNLIFCVDSRRLNERMVSESWPLLISIS